MHPVHQRHRRAKRGSLFRIESLEPRRLLSAGVFANNLDIGSPAIAGSAAYSNGTYTVTAAGSDIGGTSDQFHFAYNAVTGDGTIIARATSLLNTNSGAKSGLMFRNNVSADSAFAGIFLTPSSGINFISRATNGGTAGQSTTFGPTIPRYVRLSRASAVITAAHSNDAVTWTQFGSASIDLGNTALAGLAVTSRNVAAATTATFTGASILLPPGMGDNDVGAPALPGFATYDPTTNEFAITGAGTGIGGTADQFNFASRSMTGDGSLLARVGAPSPTDPSASAGLMIRDDLTAGAMFASVRVTAQNALTFQWRSATGAAASSVAGPSITAPVWVKLTQQGNSFSAYYSNDGASWTKIGATQVIAMTSATTFAGLAISSSNSGALSSASVTSVNFLRADWNDREIGSPVMRGSASYDASSNTYTLIGGGAGIGGTSDQFNFASRTMTGDGAVVAYLNSTSSGNPSAKAGLMIRADSSAGSPFAGLFVSAQNGLSFEWRPTAGAPVELQVLLPAIMAPVSLRLTRTGNTFTASYSLDGVSWILIASTQSVTVSNTTLAGIAASGQNGTDFCTASFTGAGVGTNLPPGAGIYSAADELFLHDLSQRSARFFYDETNPTTGMIPDGSNANGGSPSSASSIASTGFGLSALAISDARGWLSHANAYQRALNTVNFLWNTAAHVNGFFYHFINPVTGQRSGSSEVSSVDTALLMAGVLNVAEHWKGTALETVAMDVFNRVDWPWFQAPNGQFRGAWFPGTGFTSHVYGDFSEAVLIYMLGLGSSTHPTAQSSWNSWSRSPSFSYAGFNFITAGTRALFTTQYPQGWFDMRGLTDSFGLNYYVNSQNATLAQRQMFINMAGTYPHFGPNMWGATAADGQSGYTVYGGPPAANINGTIVPTAPGGALAFTPRRSVDALKNMQQVYGSTVYKKYGFIDAFNPSTNWNSSIVLGIDVGMMLLAAENSRSNFVWDVFKQSAVARQSLASAFSSITPQLLSAVSRKPSVNPVVSDVPVNLTEGLAIEARQGGPTQLVLAFGANIVKGPNFAVTLTKPGGGANGTLGTTSVSGASLTINMSGVLDAQTLLVTVTDVRHFAASASGNYTFSLGVLLADANHDGTVNANDFSILASNFGMTAISDSQGDFNFDGVVNANDFSMLASQFGKAMSAASSSFTFGRVPISGAAVHSRGAAAVLALRTEEPESGFADEPLLQLV